MVARGRKIWCARRGVAAMRWRADAGERSEVPEEILCEDPRRRDPRRSPPRWRDPRCLFAKFRWTKRDGPAGCVCALCCWCCCVAASAVRARAWVIVFLPQALIMNDPGPVRPIASGRTSRTQVADTDTTDDTHHISGTRHGSRVTRELERTISRRTKHHRTSLLRADPEQDRRRGASVTLSRSLMAISHCTPGRLT